MDRNQNGTFAQSPREANANGAMQYTYVERGVSRYGAARRADAAKKASQEKARDNGRIESVNSQNNAAFDVRRNEDAEANNVRSSSSGRTLSRFKNHRSRNPRQLADDEQPPLIDTIREMASQKSRREQDFDDRYDRSRAGAARIEREKINGGSTVREVEYFVPKISGDNAFDINYGTRKRKTHNKKPMRMWKKASLTATSLVMVFIMCIGMGFSALLNRMNFVSSEGGKQQSNQYDAQADKEAAEGAADVDDTQVELPDAVMFDADIENVLLLGSDRRDKKENGRSDAMMLLTIDRKHKKIKMTSFQRDLYIKIPGRYGTKLNSAYSVGGVELIKDTIEANLGISIDKYVIVDFTAFKTVVNKIGKINGHGGIKMTVTSAEARYMCSNETYGWFPRFQKGAGTYYMTGAEALNYARIRKIDSDFGRTKRQRKVLSEIIEELKKVGYMDLISIGYSCLEYVTTDFTKAELVGLATEAAEVMGYDMKQISIPIKGTYKEQEIRPGTDALVANLTVNAKQLAAFIYDDDMTYEGNEKTMRNVRVPSVNSIKNSNATTKSTTTTASGDDSKTTKASKTDKSSAKTTSNTKASSSTTKSSKTTKTTKSSKTAKTTKTTQTTKTTKTT